MVELQIVVAISRVIAQVPAASIMDGTLLSFFVLACLRTLGYDSSTSRGVELSGEFCVVHA